MFPAAVRQRSHAGDHGRRMVAVCVAAVASLGWASSAAAQFNVSPTSIVLTPSETSVLVTLRNDSDHTIRFQLTADTWSHDDDGRMVLGKSSDVVIYPPLVSVAAKESRRIRVGTQVTARVVEITYRMFVEELPDEGPAPLTSKGIRVRTRIGIPIFVRTGKPKAATSVEGFAVQDSEIHFAIRNTGTAHTVIQNLKLRGVGANDREVFQSTAQAGYLLAQKRQVFQLVFDPGQCAQTRHLLLTAVTDDGTVTSAVDVSPSACQGRSIRK